MYFLAECEHYQDFKQSKTFKSSLLYLIEIDSFISLYFSAFLFNFFFHENKTQVASLGFSDPGETCSSRHFLFNFLPLEVGAVNQECLIRVQLGAQTLL